MPETAKKPTTDDRAKALAHVLGIPWDKLCGRSVTTFVKIPMDKRRLRIAANAVVSAKAGAP